MSFPSSTFSQMAVPDRGLELLWIKIRTRLVDEEGCKDAVAASIKIAGALGFPYPKGNYFMDIIKHSDEDTKNKIRALAGPHDKVYLAALRARRKHEP